MLIRIALLSAWQSIAEALSAKVKAKVTFKACNEPWVKHDYVLMQGHLHTYRFCDNVWTFLLEDTTFKTSIGATGVSVLIFCRRKR